MNSLFRLYGSLLNKHGRYKVFGKTIKYNQLVQNGNFESKTAWVLYRCSYEVSNNEATITITDDSSYFQFYVPYQRISGHKYLALFSAKASVNGYLQLLGNVFNLTTSYNNFNYFYTATNAGQYNYSFSENRYNVGDKVYIKKTMFIDLTELFGAGNEPTTLEQFYATDLGKEIQKGFVPPYSATNAIYEADLSEATFSNDDGTQTQKVSILQNGQPLKLGGIGTAKDYYLNASGKVNRALTLENDISTRNWVLYRGALRYNIFYTQLGGRDLQVMLSNYNKGTATTNLNDKEFSNDAYIGPAIGLQIRDDSYENAQDFKDGNVGTQLAYELATPTTEQANSVMLRKGFTKCHDKNYLELEIEVIDPLNFSNKTIQGKNSPTITAEKIITKGFTSGGEHFTQLYIYEDGEIWYVNGDSSAQAYASGVWELEYKQLQFDNKVSLTESERNALLNIYDLI